MATINSLSFLSMAIILYFLAKDSGIIVITSRFISYLFKSTLGNPN